MEDDMTLEEEIDWLNEEIQRAIERILSGRTDDGVSILEDTQEDIDAIEWE